MRVGNNLRWKIISIRAISPGTVLLRSRLQDRASYLSDGQVHLPQQLLRLLKDGALSICRTIVQTSLSQLPTIRLQSQMERVVIAVTSSLVNGGGTVNSANYVDELIEGLKQQDIPVSDKMWQTGLACVGMPYVFGSWGALCTTSERKKRYGYNPSHTTILSSCQVLRNDNPKSNCKGCKWFPNEERTRCWDCRGFEEWLYAQFGISLEGQGATSQWNSKKNWCAKSDDMSAIPQGVIVSVFIKKDGSMSHTGFYLNGETLE